MQKKNILRLLALVVTMVMVFAIALPALAETDAEVVEDELLEEVVEEVVEEEVVEEEVVEEVVYEYAWVKYFSAPVYTAKSLDAYFMEFKAFTKVKVVESDEYWTKIEYGLWYNNLDGLGNQILWVPAYVPTSYLAFEAPEFESLFNVYVAK